MSLRTTTSIAALIAVAIAACGGETEERPRAAVPTDDPGPVHVHGLGVNPRDDALFVATHTGLFRSAPHERSATRVADRRQDTMGFTVVGPDHFLGSGHPDFRAKLPPFLGLIESRDAGRSWRPISLLGKADFHILEATGERVYGFGSDWQTREQRLLVSRDGGGRWEQRPTPEPLLSLAVSPDDPEHVVASGERRLYGSTDGGGTWGSLGEGAAGASRPVRRRAASPDGARAVGPRGWRGRGAGPPRRAPRGRAGGRRAASRPAAAARG
jgi:hypothetical protein